MELLEAIRSRRSVRDMQSTPIPDSVMLTILDAAVWAPNHRLTQPWRFAILGPESRLALVEAIIDLRVDALGETPDAKTIEKMKAPLRQRFIDVGAVVAVSYAVAENADVHRKRDDLWAVCAAIQNMQLAAWSQGVGACFVNGVVTRITKTDEILELSKRGESLVGMVIFGYPTQTPEPVERTPSSEFTRILP